VFGDQIVEQWIDLFVLLCFDAELADQRVRRGRESSVGPLERDHSAGGVPGGGAADRLCGPLPGFLHPLEQWPLAGLAWATEGCGLRRR
jgi:hypothetical protein